MMNIYLLSRKHLQYWYDENISMVVYAKWPQQARKLASEVWWTEEESDRLELATIKKIWEYKMQHFEEVILVDYLHG